MTEEGIMQCRKMFIRLLTRDEDEAERGQVGGRTAAIHGQGRWEFGGVVGTIWIWAPTAAWGLKGGCEHGMGT